MDPVTIIVSALAAGALKGAGEAASTAVKDAYVGLKSAVAARFAGSPSAEVVLTEHATDPDTYAKPLEKQVRDAGLADDPRILQLATTLLDLMKTEGTLPGKYTVHFDNAHGVQVGDHNTQTNTFS